jgi:hypothetical protein
LNEFQRRVRRLKDEIRDAEIHKDWGLCSRLKQELWGLVEDVTTGKLPADRTPSGEE